MLDSIVKRLLIRAGNSYDGDLKVVPVNTSQYVEIDSEIGTFLVSVYIKNFDGSMPHRNNSLYNVGDTQYLDKSEAVLSGQNSDEQDNAPPAEKDRMPNIRIRTQFRPKYPIKGTDLLFGNDILVPIRDYVPTAILSAGLKFFTWVMGKSMKGDVYSDKPYLYSPSLNSFTFMSLKNNRLQTSSENVGTTASDTPKLAPEAGSLTNYKENLSQNEDNVLDIPEDSFLRKKFFQTRSHLDSFVYNESTSYMLQFDSNFLSFKDSQYAVSIPTFGNRTFDINVIRYANDQLNNFNWTIKQEGLEGVGYGKLGLVINFALEDELPTIE